MAHRANPLTPGASAVSAVRGRSPWFGAALAAIALAQLVWFCWYWTVPLPNAAAAQTTLVDGSTRTESLRRWPLLAQAIPHLVLPGTGWKESLLGAAVNKLTRFEFLPQRVPIAGVGLSVVCAAIGLGTLSLRALRLRTVIGPLGSVAIGFPLGTALLAVITLALGRAGWLSHTLVRAGLLALALSGCGLELRDAILAMRRPMTRSAHSAALFAILASPFLILMILNSLQPSIEFDSLEYHLQGPKEWYQNGRIAFLPHNVYTSMPFGVEMLHLLAMYFAGDWWHGALAGQFVVAAHSINAALAVGLTARVLASPRAGWCAALVYISTPWIYRLSGFAWVEGPLNDFHAALLLATVLALRSLGGALATRWWLLIGALAGGAMACKYPALLSAVVPAGAIALFAVFRRRAWNIPLAFAIGLALTVGPWLAKNWIDHGNPVYPLANRIFQGHPWSPDRETQWSRAHGPRPVTWPELVNGLTEVAGRNDWQSPLFFALAPLAFFRPGTRRSAWILAGYAAYIFGTWWLLTHRLDRFWLPVLVPLGILAGLGADWSRRTAWTGLLGIVMLFGLFSNWFFNTTELAGLNRWTDDLRVLRRDVPRIASPTLALLDESLPNGSKVLLIGQAGVFHLTIDHIYNTVFDDEIVEQLARGRAPDEIRAALHARGITHILVDWAEIARHRKPGGYGFSDFVRPEVFSRWASAGVIERAPFPLRDKDLYRVR